MTYASAPKGLPGAGDEAMTRARGLLLAAWALTGAVIAAPAVVAAQDAPPAVRIDIAVSSRGAAVPALNAKAFTISVNGTPREVMAAEPAVAPGSGRTVYVAIDETSVFRGSEASLRTAASAIADRLAPGDRLGIVLLPQGRPALPPTDDAAAIEKALASITGRRPNDFGNFGMGVGEALAISESDTFADRGRRPRLPDAEAQRSAASSPVVPASSGGPSPRASAFPAIVEALKVIASATASFRWRESVPRASSTSVACSGNATPDNRPAQRAGGSARRGARRSRDPDRAVRGRHRPRCGVRRAGWRGSELARLVPARLSASASGRSGGRPSWRSGALAWPLPASAAAGSCWIGHGVDDPLPPGRASGAGGDAERRRESHRGGHGHGLSVKVRPYFVPPAPRTSTAAATPDARLGRALGGVLPEGERLAFDAAGYLAGLPGDTAALLIAGEVPLPAPAEDAAADRLLIEAGPPGADHRLPPARPEEAAGGPRAGAAGEDAARPGGRQAIPHRVLRRGGRPDPDTYILRVAVTDSRGRVGLVERGIVLKATGTGGASAGDILIGRIEPDQSVTLVPGVIDAADTVFLQLEAIADAARYRGAVPHRARCRRRDRVQPVPAGINPEIEREGERQGEPAGARRVGATGRGPPGAAPGRRARNHRRVDPRRHGDRRSAARLRRPRVGRAGRRRSAVGSGAGSHRRRHLQPRAALHA